MYIILTWDRVEQTSQHRSDRRVNLMAGAHRHLTQCDSRDRPLSVIQARSSSASPWAISGFRTLSSRDTSRIAAASSGFDVSRTNLTASSVERMIRPGLPRTCSGGLIAYRGIGPIITAAHKCSRPERKAAITIAPCAATLNASASTSVPLSLSGRRHHEDGAALRAPRKRAHLVPLAPRRPWQAAGSKAAASRKKPGER
jgi:hypothetical protein